MANKTKDSLSYQKMLSDVEKLVQDVGSPDIDLDKMVEKIENGYDLIKTMRSRLEATKENIDKLRAEYEGELS
jgi:exodeoxyribonuclease VII small subunit